MAMTLPKGIPTLKAHGTGNYTRTDNVFCSTPLAKSFITCNTTPDMRPPCTDHMPIISTLDLGLGRTTQAQRRVWRATNWGEFRRTLTTELANRPPNPLRTPEEVKEEIKAIDEAIDTAVHKHVPLSKPCPHSKRWWNPGLSKERRLTQKMQRASYAHRHIPEHPAHEMARTMRNRLTEKIRKTKEQHWRSWLQGLTETDVWTAQKLVAGPASDGGKTRMPALRTDTGTRTAHAVTTDEEKAKILHAEFFPPKPPHSLVPDQQTYPEPVYRWKPLSDTIIYAAIAKLKPYKARQPGTAPNCVYIYNAAQLVPRLGRVFRAGDRLGYYPREWNRIHTVVLRKPGKASYETPASYRPIVLAKGHMSIENAARNLQVTTEVELAGILPQSQFGARPGRATTDALHVVTKIAKDAWRREQVASVLCTDVKGAFPSVDLDVLTHELRMAGIPRQHTDWIQRRYAGRKAIITFDGYTSEPIDVENGLDQGDPHSGLLWLIYNSGLAKIPDRKQGEHDVTFVDDETLIATGKDFKETHQKIRDMLERPGGLAEWARSHNTTFGPAKYQLVDLSRRRVKKPFQPNKTMPEPRPDMKLGSHKIISAPAVKLLGVWIDRELRWKEQAAAAIAKGHTWLNQVSRLARPSHGVGPPEMRRLYLATCVPRMLYAADVFLTTTRHNSEEGTIPTAGALPKLRSIQRRAAILITGGMNTTPTDALDIHARLLPIHLQVKKTRHRAAVRLATLSKVHPLHGAVHNAAARYVKRHRTPLHELMHEFDLHPRQMEDIRPIRQPADWRPQIKIASRTTKETAIAQERSDPAKWKVYTDGSGIDGQIGAAAVLYHNGTIKAIARKYMGTDDQHTVYEAEGIGLNLAIGLIAEQRDLQGSVSIYADNTSAIDATRSRMPNPSHYIWDALDSATTRLRQIKPTVEITIRWSPGHMDILGNEKADEEAKAAAMSRTTNPRRTDPLLHKSLHGTLPFSKSANVQAYNAALKARANADWKKSMRYNRLGKLLPNAPTNKFQKLTKDIPRRQASILTQLRTGHAPLASHLHRIGKNESPRCQACQLENETVAHYLLACPAHEAARRLMNEDGGPNTRDITKLLSSPKITPHLMRYISRTKRFTRTMGEVDQIEGIDTTTRRGDNHGTRQRPHTSRC
ncbi:unnamed protein product [Mycena citricolor]|uniref:RNase H type-1 domain-containing protein n=1 Tax=Mycena citricolor TaxID=2018698 RepID=A0AAD2Q5Q9_9AGAR|nr:unnamed protein product [Mycena citricolor]